MDKAKPVWHGVILVAGGAVGAGMFALPMVSAGAWSLWSLLGLVAIWWVTYLAAKILLDTNLAIQGSKPISASTVHGPPLSFDTLVKSVLGARWALVNNLSLVFIMMILMYAYVSAGASIVSLSLDQLGLRALEISPSWLSVAFSIVVALVVGFGTAAVANFSVVLMILMALSFLVVIFGLLPHLNPSLILYSEFSYWRFVLAAMPVYVTAFACAGLVPTLVRHYSADRKKVEQCLFWGTLLALVIYLIWLAVTFGVLGRQGFEPVLSAGGNTADLVRALSAADSGYQSTSVSISERLMWFSHCAIITSFLSIGLGLFHFIQDKLNFGGDLISRGKAILVCFLPPTIGSFFYPKGFLVAIGYAGLFVAFSFFIVPAAMSLKRSVHNQQSSSTSKPMISKLLIVIVFTAGCVCGVLKVLYTFNLLAKFS